MTVQGSTGKVGIGTTSPVGLLELDGASSAFTLQLKETSGAYHRMGFKKNNNLFQLGEFNNDGTTFTPILNLDANGDKIGIGESSPDHIFHIKGSTPILAVESSSWTSPVSAALRLSYTDGNAREIRGHYDHGLQFTTNQGEAFRIKTDGNVSVLLGNIEIGTAGKGIDFSATSGTGTSELLDDYEEGTFTPSVGRVSGSPTVGYAAQDGYYTKTGRLVHFFMEIRLISWDNNGASGTVVLNGLPFTAGARTGGRGAWDSVTLNTYFTGKTTTAGSVDIGVVAANNTRIELYIMGNEAAYTSQPEPDSNDQWKIGGYYFV